MRICSKCKTPKEETEFFTKDSRTNKLHAQCKQCYKLHRKTYYAEHYAKYSQQYRDRAKQRRLSIRKEYHTQLLSYLRQHPCVQCSEDDVRVLEFDHIVPSQKSFGISWAVRYGISWDKIEQEMLKCQVLCANCHKKRTAEQASWYKNNLGGTYESRTRL